jgi:hypothetical protein
LHAGPIPYHFDFPGAESEEGVRALTSFRTRGGREGVASFVPWCSGARIRPLEHLTNTWTQLYNR